MNCKLYFILNKNGSISNEGTTPPKEVGEFVSSTTLTITTLTISEWEQIRKDMRKIMTQFLKQLPHTRHPHPIGEGPTITIPRVEYVKMINKIATLEKENVELRQQVTELKQENIELRRENVELRQQVVELQRENSELRKTVEMQSKQIEMLVRRIEFLEARN
jgi:predicted RNase H-like nuclease (RuvC/YqgF family)